MAQLGTLELVLILAIGLLLFGVGKLPEVGGRWARGSGFPQGVQEDPAEDETT